ncbi:hypothetical protein ACP4OV_004501 [Aristida adscensionis]
MIAGAAAAATFPFTSSFHRQRIRPCPRPRRLAVVLPPARASSGPSSSSSSSAWEEREEARWLREEQRWLREEQRWLREESRWRAEREALLAEVAALRLRLRALEGTIDAVASPAAPAAVPASQPRPALVEEVEVRKEVVVVEGKTAPPPPPPKASSASSAGGKGRRMLRAGAEGEDVRALQEALLKLGFYSGEEDMEYSSFSSGTERAVKTWQSSVGTSEDGVMTSELLDMLFSGKRKTEEDAKEKDGVNGAAVPAVTGIAEVRQTLVAENGFSRVGLNDNRVFLLGENRWEDPSRLTQKKKPESTPATASTKTCISCRGEGRLMCTECEGTGEPNIEPQFLEWIGEDTKCAYCEGLGSIVCDVCEGKKVTAS